MDWIYDEVFAGSLLGGIWNFGEKIKCLCIFFREMVAFENHKFISEVLTKWMKYQLFNFTFFFILYICLPKYFKEK